MKIKIIAVGKLKENFWTNAIDEYKKRIKPFCNLEVIEVPDNNDNAILNKIKKNNNTYNIALCIEASQKTSKELAYFMADLMNKGKSTIVFIIGGSCGLSENVKNNCDFNLSFGKITLPHNLARVVLVEQLYRSYTIINNKTYHK